MLRLQVVRLAIVLALLLIAGLFAPSFAQDLPGPSVQATKAAPAPALPSGFVAQTQGAPITDEHYRLGTGDKLKINVYGEEDSVANSWSMVRDRCNCRWLAK